MLCLREQRIWTCGDRRAGPSWQRTQHQQRQSWLNTACGSGAAGGSEGECGRIGKLMLEKRALGPDRRGLRAVDYFVGHGEPTDGAGS